MSTSTLGMMISILLVLLLFRVRGENDAGMVADDRPSLGDAPFGDAVRHHRERILAILKNLADNSGDCETNNLRCSRPATNNEQAALEIRRTVMDNHHDEGEPCIGMHLDIYHYDDDSESCLAQDSGPTARYELVEPLHLELGVVPLHAADYAYQSALAWHSSASSDETQRFDGQLELRSTTNPLVRVATTAWWKWWFVFMKGGIFQSYQPPTYERVGKRAFAGGSHGEVWRGRRSRVNKATWTDGGENNDLILKRLKLEQGMNLLEAGLREIYFGNLVERDTQLFTKYVDHFFRRGIDGRLELWIVYENAGASLRSYIYSPITTDSGLVMFQHSEFWRQLRMSDANRTGTAIQVRYFGADYRKIPPISFNQGRRVLRAVLRQILEAAARLSDYGIVHRDIKPSNVMCFLGGAKLSTLLEDEDVSHIKCVLGDFSSAWDTFTDRNLYGGGPSQNEQTLEYSPPEALMGGPSWIPFHELRPSSYDSWSIGVLALELLLGTPDVFSVDQRTTVLLTYSLKGASQEAIQRALYLAALSQFCIYPVGVWPVGQGDPLHESLMVKDSCTIQDFHQALRARDPLGIGFDSSLDPLLHLIWRLLAWDPLERATPSEALRHPFFTFVGEDEHVLIPDEENALESLMLDPRMDIKENVVPSSFVCPKCGRTFGDWRSCHSHANTRKHAKFCQYDRSQLPFCLHAHTLLPQHVESGYCDIQGRRPTIEDFHAIQLYDDHQFYGVFDGHTGNLASKFCARVFYGLLRETFTNISDSEYMEDWKERVQQNFTEIFEQAHEQFLSAAAMTPVMDQSGTTATIVYRNDEITLVASLGDSRAIMSMRGDGGALSYRQLTESHVASNAREKELVERRGGHVTDSGGVDRVNGVLVLTRSIGDAKIAPFLSREPSVVSMTNKEMRDQCEGLKHCFIVLASDGLWDVMSNQEVVDMAYEALEGFAQVEGAYQEAAERLTQEAYVRGSADNIGVCVIAIK